MFRQRRRGLAAGVELLVEELDDAHVVLDAEVVEERLADLKWMQDYKSNFDWSFFERFFNLHF